MKRIFLILSYFVIMASACKAEAMSKVRLVADNYLRNALPALKIDTDASQKRGTKQTYYNVNSRMAEWRYANGVTLQSLVALYKLTGDASYRDHVFNLFRFYFKNHSLFKRQQESGYIDNGIKGFVETKSLDNCGAMTAALIKAYELEKNEDYMQRINNISKYVLKKQTRLPEGMFCRGSADDATVWLDDLYMSVSFLAAMGNFTHDSIYFNDAANQVIMFNNLLHDPVKQLSRHCFYVNRRKKGVAFWGRANGWNLFAQATLLEAIPDDHPQRDSLLGIFRDTVEGICQYQSSNGLWHQLLDKEDSYLETSCSAMFAYAIAKGVNMGWIDKDYASVAKRAWQGIEGCITADGDIDGTCIGTGIAYDLPFYYQRPTLRNDIHGIGPVIFAGMEIHKLSK